MFLFSLLCNKQQLNCTVPAVFILFVSYIHSVINLSMAKIENKSHLSTIRPTQLKAKKKPANYSVTIENLHNLVHSDFRECSLFILFWRGGGGGYIMEERKVWGAFLRWGVVMKVFSCHLTEISTPILLANLIEIPSNSLFISSRITRCQTLDIKFFEEQEQCFFFELICNCLNCNYHCNYHIFS